MAALRDDLDLAGLRLSPGEGRRLELEVELDPLVLGSERYAPEPRRVPVDLDVSRMLGGGYALRLSFATDVAGPCMRCLAEAAPRVAVEAREVDMPAAAGDEEGAELESPYVHEDTLDLRAWAHDALALSMPLKVLCREDCRGLCPVCAANLNEAGDDHHHERAPDPRWERLRELKLE
jgi:uncharacterized protein